MDLAVNLFPFIQNQFMDVYSIFLSHFIANFFFKTILTRKCSIAAESHIRLHNHVNFKIKLFCKPIAITFDIILCEFIVSRVYGHNISLKA